MKKLVFLLVVFVGVAFADSADFCSACEPHLSNKGVMSKNTLKNKMCENDSKFINMGCFSGEVELTGVIVSAYDYNYGSPVFEVRFHPDTNLDLPFLYDSYCDFVHQEQGAVFDETTQKWDCSNVKLKFKRLNDGLKLKIDTKKVFLPKEITNKHLGENVIRAKVQLKDYGFGIEGDSGRDAWATLVEFSPLSEIYEHNEVDFESNKAVYESFAILDYESKDSFINLHDKPRGNIIAQIQESDMLYGKGEKLTKGQIWATFDKEHICFDESALDEWIEVFYLPPEATKPQEAIYGYIHKSQIGFHRCVE